MEENDEKSAAIELDDPEEIEEQSAANEFGEAETNDEWRDVPANRDSV